MHMYVLGIAQLVNSDSNQWRNQDTGLKIKNQLGLT